MSRTEVERRAAAITRDQCRTIGGEVRRLREDAGVGMRELARHARISPSYLSAIEAGHAVPSLHVLNRIALPLGADLSLKLYPNTGPRIRDRISARMLEPLLRGLHPRWRPSLEVPVRRPARGVIDCVLDDQNGPTVVAAELESDLRRLEQQIRWGREKAESLPSSDLWPFLVSDRPEPRRIARLLVLRSTRTSRTMAKDLRATFEAAFPADPARILEALRSPDAPWPGDGLLWVYVEGSEGRLLERRPRGLGVR
jgi:transcriptional regulator with XRE-family HTH domain